MTDVMCRTCRTRHNHRDPVNTCLTMPEGLHTIGMLAGGLGLFLLAVNMITDGLKLAAGQALRQLLGHWTRSLGRGVVTGVSITAIVQSSSAVTVATIGFVNAGLITMHQALGVVYGANIGTTVTGWLVAIVGFKIKVEAFALPMIGVGMLLNLTGGNSRRAAIGLAVAGFGLFFIGIDVLRETFEGLAMTLDLRRFTADGVSGVLTFLAIGFAMTVLTQSSSAAIAITLTAATGGIVGLYAAAAMVIGANVGTTSTAGFAVIGATPNARRVAAAHVIFNVVTGFAALVLLTPMFWIVRNTGAVLGLEDIPAVTLALFHTAFNLLGVLLMWPVSASLTRFLERRFVTQEETESRPRYLDDTITVSPALALNAVTLELSRVAALARRLGAGALSVETRAGQALADDHAVATQLAEAVATFINRMNWERLSEEVSALMAKLLNAEQHLLAAVDEALDIAHGQAELAAMDDEPIDAALAHFRAEVIALIELSDVEASGFSMVTCEAALESVNQAYDDAKATLLKAGSRLQASVPRVIAQLEQNERIRRMARQLVKATRDLSELYAVTGVLVPATAGSNATAAAA